MTEITTSTALADHSHEEGQREERTGQISDLTDIAEEVHGLLDVLGAMCFAWDNDDDEELEEAHLEAEAALRVLAREIDDRVMELRKQLAEVTE